MNRVRKVARLYKQSKPDIDRERAIYKATRENRKRRFRRTRKAS